MLSADSPRGDNATALAEFTLSECFCSLCFYSNLCNSCTVVIRRVCGLHCSHYVILSILLKAAICALSPLSLVIYTAIMLANSEQINYDDNSNKYNK